MNVEEVFELKLYKIDLNDGFGRIHYIHISVYNLDKMKFQLAFPTLLICLLGITSCGEPTPESLKEASANLPETVDFNYHIKPILSDRCFQCHGPDANQRKGELRLDMAENAYAATVGDNNVVKHVLSPGSLKNSEVFHRIISDDAEYMMPPPESNLNLTVEEKALIARWIQQGAEYKPHWSFVSPQKESLPKIQQKDWAQQPIDHFILEKIERNGLIPSEKADKTTLLRRASLDLTGLPPTPEDIDDFLADDSPQAFEKVIDRLLASEQYGERLGVEWLDVARYADSHGYQDDGMRNTWPWRDWVIKAFNENMPYDQFLVEQIAGDLLPNPTKDQLLATCFNRNHPQTQEGGVVEEEYRVEYVADRTNTFGKALLGITMECARCHDHKYDPISQKEYYSLFAFFNNNNDWGIVPYNGEATPTVMLPTPEEEEKLAKIRQQMKPLESAIVSDNFVADFKKWAKNKTPRLSLKEGMVASFDFDKEVEVPKRRLNLDGKKSAGWAGVGGKSKVISYVNRAKGKPDAALLGDVDSRPTTVEGKDGMAVQFHGDCGIRFNRDMDFDRHQPFSVSIWVKLLKEGEKGPIFNNTNGDFEGYRGWICKLNEDGTLSFQLNHVWPDNCIDYQTIDPIKVGEWTHITMTYNGSSKADGLHFFVNGKVPQYKLHRDNLQKSLLHGVKGSNWSNFPLMLGREKERSIENIVMDELRVWDRQLSAIEVQQLFNPEAAAKPNDEQLLEYYLLSGKNRSYNRNLTELTALRKEENLVATDILEVMVMRDRQEVRPTFVLDRGMYDAPTDSVQPNTPSVFASLPDDAPRNRLSLARWLVSKDNSLTARVQVNRLWMMLFGRGLVATQEDFGNQGNLPTHPELLDWLAVDFMENGWDMKSFLKQVMLSATYQQSSIIRKEVAEKDPTNQWYAHYPAYRLPAETIRDHALASSGLLVTKVGGPSVYPYQPKGIWKALATRNATVYQQGTGEDLYRRSMYTIWKRSAPPPSMMNFDAPDRYYCIVSRQKTATPLQSLVLMNDPQFVEASRALAERTIQRGGDQVEDRINYLFKCLVGRSPDPEELNPLKQFYQEERASFSAEPQKAQELLAVGEHPVDPTLDKTELAAYSMIASTVMNFDEFVMKR